MDASVDVTHLEGERSVRIFSRADRLLPVWKFIAREVASYRPTHAVLREVEVCVVSDDGKGVGYGCCVILVSVSDTVVKRLEAERQVIDCALRNYDALGFKGALLRINGQVEAYCLGEPMADGEAFCTHFEKASAEFPGAYAVINKLFAEMLSGEYKLINREDDAGVEGLRKAKTSYQPEFFVKKYYIICLYFFK